MLSASHLTKSSGLPDCPPPPAHDTPAPSPALGAGDTWPSPGPPFAGAAIRKSRLHGDASAGGGGASAAAKAAVVAERGGPSSRPDDDGGGGGAREEAGGADWKLSKGSSLQSPSSSPPPSAPTSALAAETPPTTPPGALLSLSPLLPSLSLKPRPKPPPPTPGGVAGTVGGGCRGISGVIAAASLHTNSSSSEAEFSPEGSGEAGKAANAAVPSAAITAGVVVVVAAAALASEPAGSPTTATSSMLSELAPAESPATGSVGGVSTVIGLAFRGSGGGGLDGDTVREVVGFALSAASPRTAGDGTRSVGGGRSVVALAFRGNGRGALDGDTARGEVFVLDPRVRSGDDASGDDTARSATAAGCRVSTTGKTRGDGIAGVDDDGASKPPPPPRPRRLLGWPASWSESSSSCKDSASGTGRIPRRMHDCAHLSSLAGAPLRQGFAWACSFQGGEISCGGYKTSYSSMHGV